MRNTLPFIFLLVLAVNCNGQQTKQSRFSRVKLAHGAAIELPSSWWLLNEGWNAVLETFAEAKLDLSGLASNSAPSKNLIAVRSMPEETYANIRIDFHDDGSTPTNIAGMTKDQIDEFDRSAKEATKKLIEKEKILIWGGTSKETVADRPATVTHYLRTGPKGPVLVWSYAIALDRGTLAMNIAYRATEAELWEPIIERSKRSLTINGTLQQQVALTPQASDRSLLVLKSDESKFVWPLPNSWEQTQSLTKGQFALKLKSDKLMTFNLLTFPEKNMTLPALLERHDKDERYLFRGAVSRFPASKFISSAKVKVGSHDAVQIQFLYTIRNLDREFTLFCCQHTTIWRGVAFTIAFECLPEHKDEGLREMQKALSAFAFAE